MESVISLGTGLALHLVQGEKRHVVLRLFASQPLKQEESLTFYLTVSSTAFIVHF